jgi:hypothetical protein
VAVRGETQERMRGTMRGTVNAPNPLRFPHNPWYRAPRGYPHGPFTTLSANSLVYRILSSFPRRRDLRLRVDSRMLFRKGRRIERCKPAGHNVHGLLQQHHRHHDQHYNQCSKLVHCELVGRSKELRTGNRFGQVDRDL